MPQMCWVEQMGPGRGRGTENPRTSLVASRPWPAMIHVQRLRQLPTNHDHAALASGLTREYQVDSPSSFASLVGPACSRDGPYQREEKYIRRAG